MSKEKVKRNNTISEKMKLIFCLFHTNSVILASEFLVDRDWTLNVVAFAASYLPPNCKHGL